MTACVLLLQDCHRLQQQIAALEDDHKGNVAELVADVDAIKKAMADQQVDYETAAQRAKQQQEEELSLLKARLATVTGEKLKYQSSQC